LQLKNYRPQTYEEIIDFAHKLGDEYLLANRQPSNRSENDELYRMSHVLIQRENINYPDLIVETKNALAGYLETLKMPDETVSFLVGELFNTPVFVQNQHTGYHPKTGEIVLNPRQHIYEIFYIIQAFRQEPTSQLLRTMMTRHIAHELGHGVDNGILKFVSASVLYGDSHMSDFPVRFPTRSSQSYIIGHVTALEERFAEYFSYHVVRIMGLPITAYKDILRFNLSTLYNKNIHPSFYIDVIYELIKDLIGKDMPKDQYPLLGLIGYLENTLIANRALAQALFFPTSAIEDILTKAWKFRA